MPDGTVRQKTPSKKQELMKMLTGRRGSAKLDSLIGNMKSMTNRISNPDASMEPIEEGSGDVAEAEGAAAGEAGGAGEAGEAGEADGPPEESTLAEVEEEEARKKENEFMDKVRGIEIETVRGEDGAADDDDSELVYGEFKECIARIADIWNPDQYLALAVKVESIINEQIMQIPLQQMAELEDDGFVEEPF